MKALLFLSMVFAILPTYALIKLDKAMTPEEEKSTGVDQLSPEQKQALEQWLDLNFLPKAHAARPPPSPALADKGLYLSENIDNGKKLKLSDGSLYEIAEDDLNLTNFWITPFPIKVIPSRNRDYPYLIINTNTGTAVKAKQLSPPTLAPASTPQTPA